MSGKGNAHGSKCPSCSGINFLVVLGFQISNFIFGPQPTDLYILYINPTAQVAWRSLEENRVKPHRLQDLIYSNIPIKTSKSKFGSLISHLVATWRTVVLFQQVLSRRLSSHCLKIITWMQNVQETTVPSQNYLLFQKSWKRLFYHNYWPF